MLYRNGNIKGVVGPSLSNCYYDHTKMFYVLLYTYKAQKMYSHPLTSVLWQSQNAELTENIVMRLVRILMANIVRNHAQGLIAITSLILTTAQDVGTVSISILQVRKPRLCWTPYHKFFKVRLCRQEAKIQTESLGPGQAGAPPPRSSENSCSCQ